MIPKDTFNDKEIQVIKIALKALSEIKQGIIQNDSPDEQRTPLNEFDIMDTKHTLMHTLTALAKLTKSPITSFQNPIQEEGRAPLTDLPQAS